MITYEIRKELGEKPRFVKTITVSPTKIYDTEINVAMGFAELENIPTQKILDYCDALIEHIKHLAQTSLRKIELTESKGDYFHAAWGWKDIDSAKREYDEWWSYVYFNREPEE
jgi:hypothetical protein